MSDPFLFVVAPYVAALAFVTACVARYVLWCRRSERSGTAFVSDDQSGRLTVSWRLALGVVAVGHLLALASPEMILRWNRQPLRLLALEGAGLIAGSAALLGLLAALVQRLRAFGARGVPPAVDVIAGTLILVEVVSGVAIAVAYRWGSSWSAVTLGPYLVSLLRFEPSTILVDRLPWLVRLHVFCAFAVLGVAPFIRPGRVVSQRLDRVMRWGATAGSRVLRSALCLIEEWGTTRLRRLHAMVLQDQEDES